MGKLLDKLLMLSEEDYEDEAENSEFDDRDDNNEEYTADTAENSAEASDEIYDEEYEDSADEVYDEEYEEAADEAYDEEYEEAADEAYDEEYEEAADEVYDEEYEEAADEACDEEYEETADETYAEASDEVYVDDREKVASEGSFEEDEISEMTEEADEEVEASNQEYEEAYEEDDDVSGDEEYDDEGDEEDDDEYEEYEETEEERRAFRRRRRIRNQILAYSTVIVFMAVIVSAAVFGIKKLGAIKKENTQQPAKQEQEAAVQQEPEEIVIDTPESMVEEEEQAAEEEDYLGEVVEACISEMPIEDKVAGLFVVTPEALTGVNTATKAAGGTQKALEEEAVGGIVYSKKNIVDEAQLTEMLSNTVNMSKYPIFLAIAEEGGESAIVANSTIEVEKTEDMAAIGDSGDSSEAYNAGKTMGTYLKKLGFNLNLAPVAEIGTEGDKSLGKRTLGVDAATVGELAAELSQGIEDAGISSCLKYFPISGASDSDENRTEITKTLEELREAELTAFMQGIEKGADFIMLSNATASEIDKNGLPCSLSREIITDVLRGELGYEGIIITGALDKKAITDYYTSGEAAKLAIAAGADMIMMPDNYSEAKEAVLAAVQDGTIPEERINESLRRIYRVKCADKLANDDE